MPKICLGTVQFGMDYGITNNSGQISKDEAKLILAKAYSNNIEFIDTAQSYGNSEKIIGETQPKDNKFKIISKISPEEKNLWSQSDVENWEKQFQFSLQLLKKESLEALFIHRSKDLLRKDSQILLDWLDSLKSRSLIKNIGISIYSKDELKYIPIQKFQMMQFPLSIFDQRFIKDETLQFLKSKGIKLLARSIFLQGLLLKKAINWPKFINPEFALFHKKLNECLLKENVSLLEASLGFALRKDLIDFILIGISNLEELSEIIGILQNESLLKNELPFGDKFWHWGNHSDLDPRLWPEK